MIKKLVCGLRKHRKSMVCIQTILLDQQGGGDIDHIHECMNCGFTRVFPLEPIPAEMASMLHALQDSRRITIAGESRDAPTDTEEHKPLLN